MAITSLFGPTPEQIQEARAMQQRQMLAEEAKPFGVFAPLYQASRGLQQTGINSLVSGLFPEAADPALREAQAVQSVQQKYQGQDFTNPTVLRRMASELSGVAPNAAMNLARAAQEEEANRANIFFKTAQAQKMLTPTPQRAVQVDLGDRIQLRDPVTNKVIETIPKGVTPAQRERMAEQQAQDEPGFIGKTGAYRNKFGEVIPATEMSKQRQGFVQAQDLLAKLNKIDYDTVKKAQSPFDYTEPGITKTIGSQVASSTVNAQTTIAATQLLEQIEKLPPGSASDADMRAAVRDFPGYGDAENLANWVNRTKDALADSLARQNELYGFPVQVKPTPRIGPKKKEQPTQSTGEWRIIP